MDISGLQPVIERTDAVHFFRYILQMGDADLLPFAPLVRLRAFDVKDDALRKFLISSIERETSSLLRKAPMKPMRRIARSRRP